MKNANWLIQTKNSLLTTRSTIVCVMTGPRVIKNVSVSRLRTFQEEMDKD